MKNIDLIQLKRMALQFFRIKQNEKKLLGTLELMLINFKRYIKKILNPSI